MAFNFLSLANASPKLIKIIINLWGPYFGAGIKLNKMSADYKFIEVTLKQRWYNTNLVGTHFGGSIYAMVDPFYMFMLIKNLEANYIVWDKAAEINFIKPGRGKLTATFTYTAQEIQEVRDQLELNQKYLFNKSINVMNEQNEIVATVIKTLYTRKKIDGR